MKQSAQFVNIFYTTDSRLSRHILIDSQGYELTLSMSYSFVIIKSSIQFKIDQNHYVNAIYQFSISLLTQLDCYSSIIIKVSESIICFDEQILISVIQIY
jgi:hypothetical protein